MIWAGSCTWATSSPSSRHWLPRRQTGRGCGRRLCGLALGSTQAFLAGEFDIPFLAWGIDIAGGNGVSHAFHGALVPIVFVTALVTARQAWTALGMGARTQAQT